MHRGLKITLRYNLDHTEIRQPFLTANQAADLSISSSQWKFFEQTTVINKNERGLLRAIYGNHSIGFHMIQAPIHANSQTNCITIITSTFPVLEAIRDKYYYKVVMITSNSSNYMILIISNKSNNNDNQTFESFRPETISHTRQLTVTKDGDSS